jgi:hypothetical protein
MVDGGDAGGNRAPGRRCHLFDAVLVEARYGIFKLDA